MMMTSFFLQGRSYPIYSVYTVIGSLERDREREKAVTKNSLTIYTSV